MSTLKKLTITNFRGFDSLEIENFSQINIFVGKNNSGKTSILESIFLLMGMSNPILPSNINQFRGLNFTSRKQLQYLFHNLKVENKPSFIGTFEDNSERKLNIQAKSHVKDSLNISSLISSPEIIGLDLNFSIKRKNTPKKTSISSLNYDADGTISKRTSKDYSEDIYAVFVTSNSNDVSTLNRYAEVIKRKTGESILKSLQSFDNTIQDVQILPDGIYFDIKGIDELLPINIMGDGIRRFLNIVTAVAERKNAVICIDEIENGLHYSAYKTLWKSLIAFSKQSNVQLFITTHNIETIACLKSILEKDEYKETRELTQVFSITKTLKSGYKAYRYSYEGLKDAIDHEIEIRN